MTGDFVVLTSPARTIFAPFSILVMEGRFPLISFNASSKKEDKKGLLCACLPVLRPRGWALLPIQRRWCQHPWGEAAGLTAPASFIARCREQNYFYHLLSLLSAPLPVRRAGRGFKQSFYPNPGMLFESFHPCPGCVCPGGSAWGCLGGSAALSAHHPVSIPPAPA